MKPFLRKLTSRLGLSLSLLAITALLAGPIWAASLPLYTGANGATPFPDLPVGPGTINDLIGKINTNLAPGNAGVTIVPGATGHVQTGANPPVLTGCGTGSPAIVGSDTAGVITAGTSAAGCTITFAVTYAAAPFCVVTWQSNLAAMAYTVSATAITVTQTSTSGNKVQYICIGQQGG